MLGCYEDFQDFICMRLSKLRLRKKISARDMSLSMGQGQGYINNIENKKNLPSMKGFYYICEFFSISPKDFFDEDVDMPELIRVIVNDLNELDANQLNNIAGIIKGLKQKNN